jgi:Raf kinase inhibitor-like YbhB/YbcL family protein
MLKTQLLRRIRMKRLTLLLLCVLVLGAGAVAGAQEKKTGLILTTPAFKDGGQIPSKYGCDGENVSPPLEVGNVPATAKSLVLVFDDIDAPGGSYVHWVVWNIDPATKEIREGTAPEGAVQGTNGFKKAAYGGPCPPTRPHKYVFRVYALDSRLTLEPGAGKAEVEKAMEGRILARGQLTGQYKRAKKK